LGEHRIFVEFTGFISIAGLLVFFAWAAIELLSPIALPSSLLTNMITILAVHFNRYFDTRGTKKVLLNLYSKAILLSRHVFITTKGRQAPYTSLFWYVLQKPDILIHYPMS
jgi:hypothetical protein